MPGLCVLHRMRYLDMDPEVQHAILPASSRGPEPDSAGAARLTAILPHHKDFMSNNAQLQTRIQLLTRHTINIQTEPIMAYR